MDYATAHDVAHRMLRHLSDACIRIEIAGSIRRRKPTDIKDVELICIAKSGRPPFGRKDYISPLHDLLDDFTHRGWLSPRLDKNGRRAWGSKFRRASLEVGSWECPLDIFIVPPEEWGACFTIRTGDADFSHLLVTPREHGGAMPTGMVQKDHRLWRAGVALHTPEESDYFAALGLPVLDPGQRNFARLKHILGASARSQ